MYKRKKRKKKQVPWFLQSAKAAYNIFVEILSQFFVFEFAAGDISEHDALKEIQKVRQNGDIFK